MASPYASARAYPSVRGPDATARIICIVIAVIAVLASASLLSVRSESHSAGNAPSPAPSRAALLAHFPVPAGATRVTAPGTEVAYLSDMSVDQTGDAYPTLLGHRQVSWARTPRYGTDKNNLAIELGITGALSRIGAGPYGLTLSLLDGRYTSPKHTGYTVIEVTDS